MEVIAAAPAPGLQHVYFFIHPAAHCRQKPLAQKASLASISQSLSSKTSRSSSAASSHTSSISTITPAGSPLRATAPEFIPAPSAKSVFVASPLYELRETESRGLGLFATRKLPRGTRIICETPLLSIVRNELHLVWEQYARLSNAKKAAYDSLSCFQSDTLGFEQASRTRLLDPSDRGMDSDDEDDFVKETTRIMATFATNAFIIEGDEKLAVFATASRLNHSCVPNVHHSYNPTLKMETVHAVRDIYQGEELFTNYLGANCHCSTRIQRWELLRRDYGFTCQCIACTDRSGRSDIRHELLNALIWGVQQFQQGIHKAGNQFIPASPELALAQAEDIVTILLESGLYGPELLKAYRLAATLTLQLKNYDKAQEYAWNEATVERDIMGTELDDLKNKGGSSETFLAELSRIMLEAGCEPNNEIKKRFGPVNANRKYAYKARKVARIAAKRAKAAEREKDAWVS